MALTADPALAELLEEVSALPAGEPFELPASEPGIAAPLRVRAGDSGEELRLTAQSTTAHAVAFLAGFSPLDGWLGLPAALIAGAGAFLLAFAVFVGRVATQPWMARPAVVGIIAVNAVWVADSDLMLAVDGFSPTVAGQVVVAIQAAGVAGLAALQAAGLRRP